MTKLNLGGLNLIIAIFLLTWAEYACNVNRPFCRKQQSIDTKIELYYNEICENFISDKARKLCGVKPLKGIGRSDLNAILQANVNHTKLTIANGK